ncbi:MAG: 2Fe-2S iron-sulfur cluster-binding protein, partial [Acidobacteriota bacterium]|nr:2Fe-2S iron-sulfur cluster-binding protein [Acidobacteriota bacterium]
DCGLSLLELAEQRGLTPPFNCRTGSCLTCETALIAGKLVNNPQPVCEPGKGFVLICCARPASALVELDL